MKETIQRHIEHAMPLVKLHAGKYRVVTVMTDLDRLRGVEIPEDVRQLLLELVVGNE